MRYNVWDFKEFDEFIPWGETPTPTPTPAPQKNGEQCSPF